MSFAFRIDVSRCIGCRACEVACVTANRLEPSHSRNRVLHLEDPRGHATFFPYLCMQCEDPPCVPACPTGASFKARDGRVLVDHELCIGCGLCVPACPYEARAVEPTSHKLEKCTLCEGRVEHGLAPACFEVCPAGARTFVEERREGTVRVGEPERPDPGHQVTRLVSAAVNPHPRLGLSGRPEALSLVRSQRPPRATEALAGTLWRHGVGTAVQGLGFGAVLAMAASLGLRVLRRRKDDHHGQGPDGGSGPPEAPRAPEERSETEESTP